jgi:LmbE family N-acetylglucosaminyl deacetylase
MGPAVRDHLEAGHDVHVVILTNGEGSAVFNELSLTEEEFAAARDDELARAARQIGVRSANIHFPAGRPAGGALTVDIALGYMRDFYTQFPGAWCKAYSPLTFPGRHPDHVASGQAAMQLLADGTAPNLRCYVEPWPAALSAFRAANPTVNLGAETATATQAVLRGFDQYGYRDNAAGMYGIGHLSVGGEFDEMRPAPTSYYHVPVA